MGQVDRQSHRPNQARTGQVVEIVPHGNEIHVFSKPAREEEPLEMTLTTPVSPPTLRSRRPRPGNNECPSGAAELTGSGAHNLSPRGAIQVNLGEEEGTHVGAAKRGWKDGEGGAMGESVRPYQVREATFRTSGSLISVRYFRSRRRSSGDRRNGGVSLARNHSPLPPTSFPSERPVSQGPAH